MRTLRRYHDGALLEPAVVEEISGYRYYTVEQIPIAQVINRLRELDVPSATGNGFCALRTPMSAGGWSPTTCNY